MENGEIKNEKLNLPQTIKIGFAFLAISAFWQLYNGVIPPILTNTFGMSETSSGVIMAMDNILALIMLPLFGTLSDRCKSPMGRRKPFILVGTIAAVALMQIIPLMDNQYAATGLVGFKVAFIVVLMLLLIAMGTYRSPAVALMPDMTPKPLRSKGNAIINLMGALGAIIYLIVTALLYSGKLFMDEKGHVDYTLLFVIVALLMIGALLVVMLTVKEPTQAEEAVTMMPDGAAPEPVEGAVVEAMSDGTPVPSTSSGTVAEAQAEPVEAAPAKHKLPKDVRKSFLFILASIALWFMSYNAIDTWYTNYAGRVWGMTIGSASACLTVTTVGMIIAFIPAAHIAVKIGRKKTIIVGLILEVVSTLSAFIFTLVADSLQRKAYLAQITQNTLGEDGIFGVAEMEPVTSILFGTYEEANAVYVSNAFHPAMFAVFALLGIGWALINVNSLPMVVDMCADSDVGKYTGYYYTASMAAQIVTPVLAGWCLRHLGYFSLFLYAALFMGAAIVTMWFVRHGDTAHNTPKGLEVFEEM
ncbi:MAG: MFS transporter [Lachnospiraceae bacterium]|nr:MFS transporter [Lachnospiraceae bacterium]